eukprot:scaffold154926_cov19-Tisochrysis_lutea.AAC.1
MRRATPLAGLWVSAQDAEGTASVQPPSEEQEEQQQQRQRQLRQKREPTPDETPTGERAVGKGGCSLLFGGCAVVLHGYQTNLQLSWGGFEGCSVHPGMEKS